MAKIIDFHDRSQRTTDNLIISKPWEFRKACWKNRHFIQILKAHAVGLERSLKKAGHKGGTCVHHPPTHFTLKGGTGYTMKAMYALKDNEREMREAYYLTGLMDCMINQVNPVLRTDILRAMYKKVFSMKEKLNVHWYGPIDHLLLPIDSVFFDTNAYKTSLMNANSLKRLYHEIRKGTEEMFDILSVEYVFYFPNARG